MEAAPPRFNKIRRASGPTEVKTSSIRFYPSCYRRVGVLCFMILFNRKIYCQIKTRLADQSSDQIRAEACNCTPMAMNF